MKKLILASTYIFLTTLSCTAPISETEPSGYFFEEDGTVKEPKGQRLKDIVAEKFPTGNLLIGATTGAWALGEKTGYILDNEFSYVTPENDFKQNVVYPDNSDEWNWERADKWISHVSKTGQILRIHAPIGPQVSNWAKDEARTAEELEKNLRDFIRAIGNRYDGKKGVAYLDVVNETVTAEGQWFGPKPGYQWENPWTKIGFDDDKNETPLYIKYAFEEADRYAPNMKLIYNHHGDQILDLDWNLIKETILYLREQGLRVDGIGAQGHINSGWEYSSGQLTQLEYLIDWAHQNDLEFHITEFSAWLYDGNSQKELQKQADTYRAVMDILIEKSKNGIVGWNTWHIDDGSGWRNHLIPSLFDSNYVAKPAYYAIQDALEGNQ